MDELTYAENVGVMLGLAAIFRLVAFALLRRQKPRYDKSM